VIAAWPSFALIGSYELLMRGRRRPAVGDTQQHGLWLIDFTAGDLLHLAFRH
jgi:hypothetical protein